MKKHVIWLLGAALLVAAGCKKNEETTTNPVGEKMTFTATIGGGEKTEIYIEDEQDNMKWKGEETIYVNGKKFTASVSEEGAESATFTGDPVKPLDGDFKYEAYYGVDYSDGVYSLRAEQIYNDNDLSNVNPMYTESDNTELTFYNICALVRLSVSGTASDMAVKSIEVSDTEKSLSGEFTVEQSTDNRYYAKLKTVEGDAKVTLQCGGHPLSSGSVDFYVALPEGEYTGLKFTVNYTTGGAEEALSLNAADNSDGKTKLTAGTLYNKAVRLWLEYRYGHDCVQLWDGGPYWATRNLGADHPWEYGDYYQWGATTTLYTEQPSQSGTNTDLSLLTDVSYYWNSCPFWQESSSFNIKFSKYHGGNSTYASVEPDTLTILELDDDVARAQFGGDWRMPSNSEFQNLQDNCYWQWVNKYADDVNGFVVYKAKDPNDKGKVNGTSLWSYSESDPHIFFPAAGFCNGTSRLYAASYGYYWSRSLNSTFPYNAYILYFDSGNVFPANNTTRYYGFTVRPVL